MADEEQEKWGFYNVYDFSYPSQAELEHLSAIIIPGSEATALDHEKVSWKSTLVTFIQNIAQNYKHIKLLGVCFGSQIIAQALGGTAEKMPGKIQIGKEVIELLPSFFDKPYVMTALEPWMEGMDEEAERVLM